MGNTKSKKRRPDQGKRRREVGGEVRATGGPHKLNQLLEGVARAACAAEESAVTRIDIAVIDAVEMKRQHRQWMGDGGVTDVLTFDLRDRRGGPIEGQILVCIDLAKKRAGPHGDWRRELALYVVHGCLHLCGYDDHDPRDFARMHAREDEILESLELGRVFSEGARRRPKKPSGNKRK